MGLFIYLFPLWGKKMTEVLFMLRKVVDEERTKELFS